VTKKSDTSGNGTVFLVGAGPGDPGLLTRRGYELMRRAGAVVYDYLVDPTLLGDCSRDCRLVYVGKMAGQHTMKQEEINSLLVQLAKEHEIIVRLKGGDPFVFGRGGEEALELVKSGVPFEIVPGVTSGIAAPAYAGVPLTHRGLATSAMLVTGHEDPTKESRDEDWLALAPTRATLAFYMGVRNIRPIAHKLIEHGRAGQTPVVLVRWGTTPRQETLGGTLETIAAKAEAADFQPPAILVVGEVADLRNQLRWFDNRPLSGRRIVVTRSRDQRSELSTALADLGADVCELPTIEIQPVEDHGELDRAIERMDLYGWLMLTSQNAVSAFFDRLEQCGFDARFLSSTQCAVVGEATAEVLALQGIRADLIPKRHTAEGLLEMIDERGIDLSRVKILFPCSNLSRQLLPDGLRERGAEVDRVVAYQTVEPKYTDEQIIEALSPVPDLVTFTSSSTVSNLLSILGKAGKRDLISDLAAASIGPITSETAREAGFAVRVESSEPTIDAFIRSIAESLQPMDIT
jgi:uroporphyrinogen III methyltransferase/synthase